MPTEKQTLANRQNAQSSTGPRTEEGKRASSLNASRHGLTGHVIVLTVDEQPIFDEFCAQLVASLNPADAVERQLAQSIAEGHWRLNRIRAIENNMFTLGAFLNPEIARPTDIRQATALANTFVEQSSRLQLLTTYEMRIHRKTRADLAQLKELQASRKAEEQTRKAEEQKRCSEEAARRDQALDEARAILAHEPPAAEPAPDFQHPNGFVFSTAQILESVRFEQRLERARAAHNAAARQANPRGVQGMRRAA